MNRILVPAAALYLAPGLALAAAPRTFLELASYAVYIMNNAISVLIVASLVIYFWGIFSTMPSSGKDDPAKRRTVLLYGLIALFVMVSVWGILRILQATLFSSESGGSGGSVPASASYCDTFGNCQ